MSSAPASPSHGDASYIRGGGGIEVNPRRLAGVLIVICIALLIALAAYLAASAANESAQQNTLRTRGVPVGVTVTGCLAVGSGVGMGVEYWQCRGSYTLAGQTFNEVIGGNRKLLEVGQKLNAVAVPGHPAVVATVESVQKHHSAEGSYIAAGVLGALAVGLAVGWLLYLRRSRRTGRPSQGSSV